jgi:signal transduction histidine kinase
MAAFATGSFRRQVPLLVALILLLAVSAFGAVAFRSVRSSAIEAADSRLDRVTQLFVTLFSTSFTALSDSARAVASEPSLGAALRGRAEPEVVRGALRRLGPLRGQVRQVELRDAEGAPVLVLDTTAGAVPMSVTPAVDQTSELGLTPLFTYRDTVSHEIRAPVLVDGGTVGWVVQVRALRADPDEVRQVAGLIGTEASLLVGNADGSLWTDLVGVTERPPPREGRSLYERDGRRRRAATAELAGTPFYVAVEFPDAEVLGPTTSLLFIFAGLAVAVVALGTLAGWLLSRRITTPIVELSGAADRIAAGDLNVAAGGEARDDEVGRLARSFNVMASRVREARDRLEQEVADRTGELHAAQEELVRKERLATLGQLSSSVGHELRNPLGVMTNAVYYLQHTLPDAKPKVREYLQILDTQIRLSEKIVADLLDFARVRSPETARVAVSDLVDDQLERVDVPDAVRVERDLPGDLPAVAVDPIQVGQVILNVLTNGVQAMTPRGGGVLGIRARADQGLVRLTVYDTGPGVPPEHREQVFEPLFTTKARGIGLGLSVSRSLIRANGGDLVLLDGAREGAAFEVLLPAEGTT